MTLFRLGPTTLAPILGAAAAVIQALGQLVAAQVEGRTQTPSPGAATAASRSTIGSEGHCSFQLEPSLARRGCPAPDRFAGSVGLAVLSSR